VSTPEIDYDKDDGLDYRGTLVKAAAELRALADTPDSGQARANREHLLAALAWAQGYRFITEPGKAKGSQTTTRHDVGPRLPECVHLETANGIVRRIIAGEEISDRDVTGLRAIADRLHPTAITAGDQVFDVDDQDLNILKYLAKMRTAKAHEDVATEIGMDRKPVGERLKKLRQQGLTAKVSKGEVITDRALAWLDKVAPQTPLKRPT